MSATADKMAAEVGFGLDCAGVVWHPSQGSGPNILSYVPADAPDVTSSTAEEDEFDEPKGEGAEPAEAAVLEKAHTQLTPPTGAELAATLHAAAMTPQHLFAKDSPEIDPIPDGVAGKEFLVTERVSRSYHPKSYTWESPKKPIVIRSQTADVSLPFFVELYASTQPEKKFVRVTTWGTGFNPGKLREVVCCWLHHDAPDQSGY